ncbi:MAG: RNA degradosome polyphosphate kinase [Lachnospiraceae bacterium]|nr:RNA degradosome polyphosphate kinase [Lachnospiraceae bacterium]
MAEKKKSVKTAAVKAKPSESKTKSAGVKTKTAGAKTKAEDTKVKAAGTKTKTAETKQKTAGTKTKSTASKLKTSVLKTSPSESTRKTEKAKDYYDPANFDNRELSWLDFDTRIYDEAADDSLLLFERLKFLSIVSSNLDEFFMVRVASLKDMVSAEVGKRDIAGMTPTEQLSAISEKTHNLVSDQYELYQKELVPSLAEQGLVILSGHENLSDREAAFVDEYFETHVYPVLTPMAVDSSRPFPLIRNKTLNIAAFLSNKEAPEEVDFATVQVPSVIPRFVEIKGSATGERKFILLEEIIERNIGKLFLNYDVLCAHPYRIMRNADFEIDEEEAEDLLAEISKKIKRRQWGEAIRLEVDSGMDPKLLKLLKKELHVEEEDIYRIPGPLDLTFLMKFYGVDGCDSLRLAKHIPAPVPEVDPELPIFDSIRKQDIFLFHPYQTFDPVVEFVRQASVDKDVLAIKQTLYRVSGNSPIIAALARAAENGKQVSVLVELKARFDEENNIAWAQKLEKAGCHVIYGLKGLKTHSKITLVVRREEEGITRYVHLATGNYNDATAKLYTDMGIFTCNRAVGEDATAVFNMLSGYSEPLGWNHLVLAPLWLRKKLVYLIRRETEYAKQGRKASVKAKMNSLCDPEIIAELYKASEAGVQIDLVVRGICCLKPQVPGLSENIRVRSIVGNFLEHSRVFLFENDGDEQMFLASADWMPRNLDRRVEIMFPVLDRSIMARIKEILEIELADTMKARVKTGSTYTRVDRRGKAPVTSQLVFTDMMKRYAKEVSTPENTRVFVPMMKPGSDGVGDE